MAEKTTSSIQVIGRVTRLLETIAVHNKPVSLKVLSDSTGLHPSTAFRILASLTENGLVERSEAGRCYRLGGKFLQLSYSAQGLLGTCCKSPSTLEVNAHAKAK
jgi:DNA-binding IclR family transcriptional regulator